MFTILEMFQYLDLCKVNTKKWEMCPWDMHYTPLAYIIIKERNFRTIIVTLP